MSRYDDIPTLEAAATLLSEALDSNGDQKRVAALFGCSDSIISQHCNKNNPIPSWYSNFKRFLWCVFQVNPQGAEKIFRDLSCAVETWRGRTKGEPVSSGKLIENILKECAEIAAAEIDQRPIDERIAECIEARDAVQKQLDALVRAKRLDEGSRFVGSTNYTKAG